MDSALAIWLRLSISYEQTLLFQHKRGLGRQSRKTATIASSLKSGPNVPAKVNSRWPNPRLLIALHSPSPLGETGLRICPAEKRRDSTSFQLISPFSAVRFADEILRNTGMFRVFRGKSRRDFSAAKTCWRSAQSGANFSPREFPANRENNREFAKF